ncbi:hypothetical protein [Candidatus Lariskella endosymbiont of Hedychridium roseum]|uniref:hypothetical protein n=1 Tax=Candidatus Lariskella endosymbiont of Hedychridium roseum TaxID=3077949 RepID=UPI0030D2120E
MTIKSQFGTGYARGLINYASATASPAAWQDFVDNADFFDDIANSDLAWITFVESFHN